VAIVALLRLATIPAHLQMSIDKEDVANRYQRDTLGRTIDDSARHLEDRDPGRRLQAIRLSGEFVDAKADPYLERAVDNPDPRISSAAVDFLGKRGAKDASGTLSDNLLSPGTNAVLRPHILLSRLPFPGGPS
jgi:hypothetical protein